LKEFCIDTPSSPSSVMLFTSVPVPTLVVVDESLKFSDTASKIKEGAISVTISPMNEKITLALSSAANIIIKMQCKINAIEQTKVITNVCFCSLVFLLSLFEVFVFNSTNSLVPKMINPTPTIKDMIAMTIAYTRAKVV